MEAITEATGLYRALATARPKAFLPDLAMSLNNQAIQLGNLGRHEEALQASTEATGLYRTLAKARPAVHQLDLERSLQVLAWLHSLGEEDAAD